MVANKRAFKKTSNYILSMNRKSPEKKNEDFLGKVRSNFLGTEFILYDKGLNPTKTSIHKQMRMETGSVLYEKNWLGSKKPRTMKVLIPAVDPNNNTIHEYRPRYSREGLIIDYKNNQTDKMNIFTNR
jgi:tubby and related proteins